MEVKGEGVGLSRTVVLFLYDLRRSVSQLRRSLLRCRLALFHSPWKHATDGEAALRSMEEACLRLPHRNRLTRSLLLPVLLLLLLISGFVSVAVCNTATDNRQGVGGGGLRPLSCTSRHEPLKKKKRTTTLEEAGSPSIEGSSLGRYDFRWTIGCLAVPQG